MPHLIPSDVLEAVCSRYRNTGSTDFRMAEDLAGPKKLAARKHLLVPAASHLIAVIDGTYFKTLEYGLAICDDGLYWINKPSSSTRMNSFLWNEFTTLQIGRSDFELLSASLGKNIEFGEGSVFDNSSSDFPAADLVELLQIIQFLVCKYVPAAAREASENNPKQRERVKWPLSIGSGWNLSVGGFAIGPFGSGWNLSVNETVVGPFNVSTIHAIALADELDPETTLVWREGMSDWQPVASISRLLPTERPAPPPTPPLGTIRSRLPSAAPKVAAWLPTAAKVSSAPPVEVNSASAEQLLRLPFMTMDRVKAVLHGRKANQGLSSLDDLIRICSLKPHEADQVGPRVVFHAVVPGKDGGVLGKRVVDF
jgi:hypothetical protein